MIQNRIGELLMQTLSIEFESQPAKSCYCTGSGLIGTLASLLGENGLKPPFFIIAGTKVGRLYGDALRSNLAETSLPSHYVEIPDGERFKTLATAKRLYDIMIEKKLDRHSTVIALGGGVICDLAGFVAATYMRGISHAFVPSTLLAQVDASIGGKVAVDHPRGKNLLGTFHQPRFIVCDTDLLKTLSRRQFACGMAEVIKTALLGSARFFQHLEGVSALQLREKSSCLQEIIFKTAGIKADIVMADPFERNLRAHLNLGHTLGHAIETAGGYRMYFHGEAIALGMIAASRLAELMGIARPDTIERLRKLLRKFNLPLVMKPLDRELIIASLAMDKKRHGGLRFILPCRPGEVLLSKDVTEPHIRKVIDELME
jgi:3-dehydroquinate synthase